MKLVLAVVFVFLTNSAADVDADEQCGNNKFCRIGYRPFLLRRMNDEQQVLRNYALKLEILAKNKILGVRNQVDLNLLIAWQNDLCQDDTLGFVLDKNVSDYRISCVWTGATQFGQCRAVPPEYMDKAYYYIDENEWAKKLTKVRTALGCDGSSGVYGFTDQERLNSTTTQKSTKNIRRYGIRGGNFSGPPVTSRMIHTRVSTEFYICNERCVQGGIGYTASIVIILTLATSFFQNCVERAN